MYAVVENLIFYLNYSNNHYLKTVLAWENHGFRTEVSGTDADEDHFSVPHLAAEITQVAAMPSYAAMEKIIAALS